MTDHVLLIYPWARENLCGEVNGLKTGSDNNVVTPFEIVRGRKTKTGHTPITVSFDFEGAYLEDVMCAACYSMIIVAQANKIDLDTPNLKSRITRLLREQK